MRALILVGLVGCTYLAPEAASDLPIDASPATDTADIVDAMSTTDSAPPDAPVTVASCAVGVANLNGTDRGQVGANGGSTNPTPLACASPSERIVGIALRMSNQNTDNGGRSAHALQIACATVTVIGNAATVGTITMQEVTGTGGFHWAPSTLTSTTLCQPGWIVSGLHAHEGSSQNLFVDVAMQCTQITSAGAVGSTELITVAGSLTNNQNASVVDCNPGEVVTRMPNRKGAGIDAMRLSCSTPICM